MSEYEDGYNHGKNGGSWRNDFTPSENSGFNAGRQEEESRRYQQMAAQQAAQQRQQDDLRRSQQVREQQVAQQRQWQTAQQEWSSSLGQNSFSGSAHRRTSSGHSGPTDWRGFGWFLVFSAAALTVYYAYQWLSPYLHGKKMDIAASELFSARPTISSDGVDTYPASEVTKFRWLHDKDHPMHLNGRTVVVTGDVSYANIHVNGNVTFQGTLRNVSVEDDDEWTITANNVENSTLTARRIVVKGTAVGTKEILTGAVKTGRTRKHP